MTKKNIDFIVLILSMIACGLISVLYGKDLCWDLANYHYYNPYAFFHDRKNLDFLPTTFVHQFINPAIDFIPYLLIRHSSPLITVFTLGAIHGINLWLLFLIAQLFLSGKYKVYLAIFLAILGMYGPTTLPAIGSFQNDELDSIFVLVFVYLQLKVIKNYLSTSQYKFIEQMFAGFFLGIAIGLKLTATIYLIGGLFAVAFIKLPKTTRFKLGCILSLGIGLGILLSSGFWMWHLWQQYQNPLFPYFNNIFQSPYFSAINWRDTRFLPHGLSQILFYPFYFSPHGYYISDTSFQDYRFAYLYILFIIAGIKYFWQKFQNRRKQSSIQSWLFIFLIFSYIPWEWYFSIARYLAPLEMLAPLGIYLLVTDIFSYYFSTVILVFIFETIILFLTPITLVRIANYEQPFFNIHLSPSITQMSHATVLVSVIEYMHDIDPRPQLYLIPFFPQEWRFIGIPFYRKNAHIDATLESRIKSHALGYEKIYLLSSDVMMPRFYQAVEKLGFAAAGKCEFIYTDRQIVNKQKTLLCPVRQIDNIAKNGHITQSLKT